MCYIIPKHQPKHTECNILPSKAKVQKLCFFFSHYYILKIICESVCWPKPLLSRSFKKPPHPTVLLLSLLKNRECTCLKILSYKYTRGIHSQEQMPRSLSYKVSGFNYLHFWNKLGRKITFYLLVKRYR